MKEQNNLENLRHSAAHLLAAAVLELYPETKLTIGPATADGFYYDLDLGEDKITGDNFKAIEKKMAELVQNWTNFESREVGRDEALAIYQDNQYKQELINEIADKGEKITLYTCGEFTDLCRGGHIENPAKALKHFKLLTSAGAYWRGDEKSKMLTRIYGTAFETKEALKKFLEVRDEAIKRDHRKLGKELDLFTFSPLVGSGLPLFTPRGTIIREELQNYIAELQAESGYERVTIPHLAKPDLYKTSGHWDKFSDDIFHVRGKNENEFVLKPMNCPHHTQIFASRQRSYRDLPQRYAEVTMMYRDEQAGELQGLSRVRSISIDDGHVFCRADQIEQEIDMILDLIDKLYTTLDLDLSFRLSLRDMSDLEKYLGGDEVWEAAEEALRSVLRKKNVTFVEEEGEAAFYGPKIDFVAKDSLGREWQLATCQLDFQMPERFGLEFVSESGSKEQPVMIHRAILGSLERFMSLLLEHYAGALPLWLSPVQVAILPISDEQRDYAYAVESKLKEVGLRTELDERSESIGKKIREAEKMKVPVMLIIGKQEVASETVAVRLRGEPGDQGSVKVSEVVTELRERKINRN